MTADQLAHRKDVRLAHAALMDGLASRWDAAERHVQRINVECGGTGLTLALMAWCDAYCAHATDGHLTAQRVNVAVVDVESGRLDGMGSDATPARVRWAARLIQARAAMDEAAFNSCLADLPDDGVERANHIWAVLQSVAVTINGLPRGFARMGKEGPAS